MLDSTLITSDQTDLLPHHPRSKNNRWINKTRQNERLHDYALRSQMNV